MLDISLLTEYLDLVSLSLILSFRKRSPSNNDGKKDFRTEGVI